MQIRQRETQTHQGAIIYKVCCLLSQYLSNRRRSEHSQAYRQGLFKQRVFYSSWFLLSYMMCRSYKCAPILYCCLDNMFARFLFLIVVLVVSLLFLAPRSPQPALDTIQGFLCELGIYTLIQYKGFKSHFKNVLVKSSKKYSILLSAFQLRCV